MSGPVEPLATNTRSPGLEFPRTRAMCPVVVVHMVSCVSEFLRRLRSFDGGSLRSDSNNFRASASFLILVLKLVLGLR